MPIPFFPPEDLEVKKEKELDPYWGMFGIVWNREAKAYRMQKEGPMELKGQGHGPDLSDRPFLDIAQSLWGNKLVTVGQSVTITTGEGSRVGTWRPRVLVLTWGEKDFPGRFVLGQRMADFRAAVATGCKVKADGDINVRELSLSFPIE